MLYLKKYFTEGLIQVAILLSLCGVRVDVGPYLPAWQERILGPSSALTQTQFHNLRNRLDGYDLHPKSVDLDGFFTARRLLGWVRSLDRLQVPGAELEAWLVHRENSDVLTGLPGLEDPTGDPAEPALRPGAVAGVGPGPEAGYGAFRENGPDEPAPPAAEEDGGGDGDVTKENEDWMDTLWPVPSNHDPHQAFGYGRNPGTQPTPPLFLLGEDGEEEEEEEDEELARVNWREGGRTTYDRMNRELVQELSEQFAGLEAQSSMSLQECLRLLEDSFPFGQEQQLSEAEDLDLREAGLEEPSPGRRPLLSPLLAHDDPSLDLEQQWQDLLAIMEPEDMDMSSTPTPFPSGGADNAMGSGPIQGSGSVERRPNPVHRDVNLRQASPPPRDPLQLLTGAAAGSSGPPEPPSRPQPGLFAPPPSATHNLNASFHHPPALAPNGTAAGHPVTSGLFPEEEEEEEEQSLPSSLGSLLEDAAATGLLDEISLLDLALEEEDASQLLASRLDEEEEELGDSDSGLSLDFSHGPASPSGSEASYSSSSSSRSSASSEASLFSDRGAGGYDSDMEAVEEEEEEGAVGGYSTDMGKICATSYQDFDRYRRLPRLEHVGHDHTYNQPGPASAAAPGKAPKTPRSRRLNAKPYGRGGDVASDKAWGRDERQARAMKIPFSNERIVNLPVDEFNTLLAKHRLSEAQLALVRDIRRRGKNKMAAQNCRRRKLDVLVDLEEGVAGLRRRRARLLKEKAEVLRSVQEMKRRVGGLYQEVFSRLRDQGGRPLTAADYALQFADDGRILVTPRRQGSDGEPGHGPGEKQRDRKK